MENIKLLLGKRIKELRKGRNLTQERLAELAGIEIPSLSNIENGKNYPSHETLEKLAGAFGVRPFELFLFEAERSNEVLLEEMISSMKNDEKLVKKMYKYFLCVK